MLWDCLKGSSINSSTLIQKMRGLFQGMQYQYLGQEGQKFFLRKQNKTKKMVSGPCPGWGLDISGGTTAPGVDFFEIMNPAYVLQDLHHLLHINLEGIHWMLPQKQVVIALRRPKNRDVEVGIWISPRPESLPDVGKQSLILQIPCRTSEHTKIGSCSFGSEWSAHLTKVLSKVRNSNCLALLVLEQEE